MSASVPLPPLRSAPHSRQRTYSDIFLSLHRLTTSAGARDFAECLADVATLNAQHGPFDEDERAEWLRLSEALQGYLDRASQE